MTRDYTPRISQPGKPAAGAAAGPPRGEHQRNRHTHRKAERDGQGPRPAMPGRHATTSPAPHGGTGPTAIQTRRTAPAPPGHTALAGASQPSRIARRLEEPHQRGLPRHRVPGVQVVMPQAGQLAGFIVAIHPRGTHPIRDTGRASAVTPSRHGGPASGLARPRPPRGCGGGRPSRPASATPAT